MFVASRPLILWFSFFAGLAQINEEGAICLLQSDTSVVRRAQGVLLQERGSIQSASALFADVRATQSAAAQARSPERLESWVDAGQAARSRLSGSELDRLAATITAKAYENELQVIAGIAPSRFLSNDGNVLMADHIESEFQKLGLTVWSEPLEIEGTRLKTWLPSGSARAAGILGYLKGTDLSDEVVVVGAHFDSVNWEHPMGQAPGVDDNGSGVALLLQGARVLAAKEGRPRRSVLFAAFNAEELGLFGSEEIARIAATGKYGNIKAAIIADEVAWPGSGSPQRERQAIFETVGTVEGTTDLLDTFAHSVRSKRGPFGFFGRGDGVDGFKVNKHGFSSDHISFLNKGIPTVLLIEGDNMKHADEWGHSARDTFEHVDFAYGASMSRLAVRVAATLAWPA